MGLFDWLGDVWNDYIGWWTSDKPRRDPLLPESPANSLPEDKVAPDPAKTVTDGIDGAIDWLSEGLGDAGNAIGGFFQGILDWFAGIGKWLEGNWWLIAIVVVLFIIIYFGRGGAIGAAGGGGTDDRDVIIKNYFHLPGSTKRAQRRQQK